MVLHKSTRKKVAGNVPKQQRLGHAPKLAKRQGRVNDRVKKRPGSKKNWGTKEKE